MPSQWKIFPDRYALDRYAQGKINMMQTDDLFLTEGMKVRACS